MSAALAGKPIAHGLSGPVYRTVDAASGETVAVKYLQHQAETVRHYFFNEHWLLSRAQVGGGHPHLSRLVSSNVNQQPWSIATRYVAALQPAQLVRLGSQALIAQIIMQIGAALDYLHHQHPDHPVIHRDVKPANILVDRNTGNAVLIDLSIARSAYACLPGEQQLGTLQYMAPEHYRGQENTAADQFALALCAFYYLTGCHLLPAHGLGDPGATPAQLAAWLERFRHKLQQRLRQHPATAAVLLRGLAPDPLERFTTCSDFALALRQALRSDHTQAELPVLSIPIKVAQHNWRLLIAILLTGCIAAILLLRFSGG